MPAPCRGSRCGGRPLAGWLDAEVIAAHGLRPGPPRADVPAASIGAQVAFTLERDWCAPLRAAAVPYRLVVREGSPVDVLQQVVETEAPELVVTGRTPVPRSAAQHQPGHAGKPACADAGRARAHS